MSAPPSPPLLDSGLAGSKDEWSEEGQLYGIWENRVATGSKEVGIPREVGQKGVGKEGLCSPPLWRVLVSGELRKLWRKKTGAVHGTNPNSPHHRVHVPGTCQMCCSHGQAQLPTYSPTDLRCTSNPFVGPGLTSPQQQCQQRGQRQQQQRCRGGCTEQHGGESGLSAGQTARVSAL